MQRDRRLHPIDEIVIGVLVMLAFMAWPMAPRVLAHKVSVFAWVEGDAVHVEGYFAGGKKAHDSLVEVFNPAGAKLLQGKTDDKGQFSFTVPEKTDLRIVLTASMGHKNDFIVTAGEFAQDTPLPSPSLTNNIENPSAPPATDLSRLEAMIDQALDRKLAPLTKAIRDSQKKGPTVTEIIGGIGYIVGLMGLVMYFNNRKKQ